MTFSALEAERATLPSDDPALGRWTTFLRVTGLIALLATSWLILMVCVLLPISLIVINAIEATGRT